jgi:hypothetical protein
MTGLQKLYLLKKRTNGNFYITKEEFFATKEAAKTDNMNEEVQVI